MIDIVGLLKKAHTYKISAELQCQKQAELLWEMLRVAICNNGRAKKMMVIIDGPSRSVIEGIDWSFTKNGISCGTIAQLEVNTFGYVCNLPPLHWNSLATVDTIIINWRQLIKSNDNTFWRTPAKRLKVEFSYFDKFEILRMLRQNDFIDASMLNVTEVTFVYNDNVKQTFPCKQVWLKLENWLTCLPLFP